MNPIQRTIAWFETAGQMTPDQAPDVRQTAFYTGMQVEELAEKLTAIFGTTEFILHLDDLATGLKAGVYNFEVSAALATTAKAEALFDADLDLIWVSIGGARAQGADVAGGYAHVGERNDAKFPDGVVTRHPTTGKVVKPEGWTAPDLTPFLHPTLVK